MKELVMAVAILMSSTVFATVVELEDNTANRVIAVYEEMREEQEAVPEDNGWIHDFETDSVGSEMDHFSTVKKTADHKADF